MIKCHVHYNGLQLHITPDSDIVHCFFLILYDTFEPECDITIKQFKLRHWYRWMWKFCGSALTFSLCLCATRWHHHKMLNLKCGKLGGLPSVATWRVFFALQDEPCPSYPFLPVLSHLSPLFCSKLGLLVMVSKLFCIHNSSGGNASTIIMALWNRAGHYIFILWFLSIFFSSTNLIGCTLDVYHTLTHGVTLMWT